MSQIELIFLHLPKTGGSSVLQALNQVYGTEAVQHFERDECMALIQKGKRIADVLFSTTKVIHGHFLFSEIEDLVERDDPKLVTFMRQPNERLISNYHWWKHTIEENPNHPVHYRRNETLEMYSSRVETQNKMSRFLMGAQLDQFFFIGFLERFERDIRELANRLNWPEVQIAHEKKRSEDKKSDADVEGRLMYEIEMRNQKDWELYRSAQKLLEVKNVKMGAP